MTNVYLYFVSFSEVNSMCSFTFEPKIKNFKEKFFCMKDFQKKDPTMKNVCKK